MQDAAKLSKWNFQNKASLLLAEKLSFSQNNLDAEVQYANAVKEAKSSSFVHEEGLASELAGAHYERLGNIVKALPLFQQAENCYIVWGSIVKTRQMQEKIRSLQVLWIGETKQISAYLHSSRKGVDKYEINRCSTLSLHLPSLGTIPS